jgi:hypothetical protein
MDFFSSQPTAKIKELVKEDQGVKAKAASSFEQTYSTTQPS